MTQKIKPLKKSASISWILYKLFFHPKEYYDYIKGAFTIMAPVYDIVELFTGDLRQKTAQEGMITPEEKVIDFCTGTGALALELAKYSPNVVGIDLSEGMLEVAKRKDTEEKIKFIQMDATNISFSDNEFDVCCISMALHDMTQEIRDKVLDEMRRVTKKRSVIVDYYIPKNHISKLLRNSLIYTFETKYFRDFAKRDLKKMLEEHKFRIIKEAYAGSFLFKFKIYVCDINERL